MKKYKISTIIPVYNSEKTLKECLDSIVNQTIGFENIELIIVNDGSKDSSDKIIQKYDKKYDNVIYIKKENGGQSTARNQGLKKATGEYISFIDSDDNIKNNMYEELLNEIKGNDIITCDFYTINNNKSSYTSTKKYDNSVITYLLTNCNPWNKLIKREFLTKINFNFPEGIIYEDLASIPALAFHTKKIKHIDKALYNYYIHDNSTIHQRQYNKKFNDIFKSVDILYKTSQKYDQKNKYTQEIEYLFIIHFLFSAGLKYLLFKDPENKVDEILNIMNKKFPNWKQNRYLKKEKVIDKFKINLIGKKKYKTIMFLMKIKGIN